MLPQLHFNHPLSFRWQLDQYQQISLTLKEDGLGTLPNHPFIIYNTTTPATITIKSLHQPLTYSECQNTIPTIMMPYDQLQSIQDLIQQSLISSIDYPSFIKRLTEPVHMLGDPVPCINRNKAQQHLPIGYHQVLIDPEWFASKEVCVQRPSQI